MSPSPTNTLTDKDRSAVFLACIETAKMCVTLLKRMLIDLQRDVCFEHSFAIAVLMLVALGWHVYCANRK